MSLIHRLRDQWPEVIVVFGHIRYGQLIYWNLLLIHRQCVSCFPFDLLAAAAELAHAMHATRNFVDTVDVITSVVSRMLH